MSSRATSEQTKVRGSAARVSSALGTPEWLAMIPASSWQEKLELSPRPSITAPKWDTSASTTYAPPWCRAFGSAAPPYKHTTSPALIGCRAKRPLPQPGLSAIKTLGLGLRSRVAVRLRLRSSVISSLECTLRAASHEFHFVAQPSHLTKYSMPRPRRQRSARSFSTSHFCSFPCQRPIARGVGCPRRRLPTKPFTGCNRA